MGLVSLELKCVSSGQDTANLNLQNLFLLIIWCNNRLG